MLWCRLNLVLEKRPLSGGWEKKKGIPRKIKMDGKELTDQVWSDSVDDCELKAFCMGKIINTVTYIII